MGGLGAVLRGGFVDYVQTQSARYRLWIDRLSSELIDTRSVVVFIERSRGGGTVLEACKT